MGPAQSMGTVPAADRAIVDPAKVRLYLLSAAHRVGRFKARFFGRFGFHAGDPDELVCALLSHVRDNAVAATETSPYGTKYRVEGPLTCPDRRNPRVATVWMILNGESLPRFVTAFPC
jgi:hypothetical protein